MPDFCDKLPWMLDYDKETTNYHDLNKAVTLFCLHFRDQILLIDGQKLVQVPWKILQEIETFLNITPYFKQRHFIQSNQTGLYCFKRQGCMGKNKGTHHTSISSKHMELLKDFYRKHNEQLRDMTNRTFSWMEG